MLEKGDNNNNVNSSTFQYYVSVKNLLETQFEEGNFIIDNFLPFGSLALLSARPKAGKTNLALQMATCIASGKFFLGRRTEKSKVLFISLELNQRQMKKRLINVLNYYQITDLDFKKFPFVVRFSNEKNGIEALGRELRYLDEKYNIKFDVVFIDTYVLFKDINKEAIARHKSVYELESEYLAKLRKFCEETNTTIVLIYHNRKAQPFSGDITENIMGSTGIAGAVNEIFLLDRKTGSNQARLDITGHNIEEETIELKFDKGLFELLTATKKELMIVEKIIKYLEQVNEATTTDIFNNLRALKITADKPLVIEILKKFDIANNKAGYWKCREEKRKNGRAMKLYSLSEKQTEGQIEQQSFIETLEEDFDELLVKDEIKLIEENEVL
jgi:hypothetical protein